MKKIENISTLKIQKLTKDQFQNGLENDILDDTSIYLTPVEIKDYALKSDLNTKADLIDNKIPEEQIPDIYLPKEMAGSPNGVATLDAEGKVPVEQIPDDIIDLSDYYTKTEVDEEIDSTKESFNAELTFKADLVDGKIPASQLPDDIGGGVSSWNDLEDKPFGIEDVNFTLPEDTSNLTTVNSHPISVIGDISLAVTKVSENYFNSPEETYGIEIGLTANGTSMDFVVVNSDIVRFDNGFMAHRMDGGWYPLYINITSTGTATIDVTSVFGENLIFDFTETGLYLLNTEGLIRTDYFRYENIKKIDKKFLPSGTAGGLVSWNDLTDKPFYKEGFSIEPPSNISEAIAISSQPLEAMGGSFTFVKGADAFNTPEETYGALVKLYNDGDIMEFTIDSSWLNVLDNGFALIYINEGFFPLIINANSSGTITLPTADILGEDMIFEVAEPGAYFINLEGVANVVSYEQYDIKKIDKSLIPDVFVKSDAVGIANGVASLNSEGKVPLEQLSININVDNDVNSYSTNPVSSQAVYNALQNIDLSSKQDKISVTTLDNGKFMRVINGKWAAVMVPSAEDGEF